MSDTIWLLDSDFCDMCGELLDIGDFDGLCATCAELYLTQEDEDDWGDYEQWEYF